MVESEIKLLNKTLSQMLLVMENMEKERLQEKKEKKQRLIDKDEKESQERIKTDKANLTGLHLFTSLPQLDYVTKQLNPQFLQIKSINPNGHHSSIWAPSRICSTYQQNSSQKSLPQFQQPMLEVAEKNNESFNDFFESYTEDSFQNLFEKKNN